ncbi:hypothetical protein J6590_070079 [Homalodisca vitripennis]|nr:hypothetical protein J6590_070079 [Homalodisca vitripennis]
MPFLLGSGCSQVTESLAKITPYWNMVQSCVTVLCLHESSRSGGSALWIWVALMQPHAFWDILVDMINSDE